MATMDSAIVLRLLNEIIDEDEGGWNYTNDPRDPGGETYAGMTRRLYERVVMEHTYLGKWAGDATANLDILNAYMEVFCVPVRMYNWQAASDMDIKINGTAGSMQGLAKMFLSCAINLGMDDAVPMLQCALYVKDDGHFGSLSLKALNALRTPENIKHVREHFIRAWQEEYYERAYNTPHGETYISGWLNRVRRYAFL